MQHVLIINQIVADRLPIGRWQVADRLLAGHWQVAGRSPAGHRWFAAIRELGFSAQNILSCIQEGFFGAGDFPCFSLFR